MEKCRTIEEGVLRVLEIYNITPDKNWAYIPASEGDLVDTILLDGKKYPLFWWRCDTQVAQLIFLAPERQVCSMKLNRTVSKREGLDALMYREFDIAEQVFDSRIAKVMCFQNQNAMNMISTMENEGVAIFELAAALHEHTPEQGRHIYWGQDGMASDRVVSQKIPSEALYLFTDDAVNPETYNDIFIYLYGLEKIEAVKAAAIIEILMGRRDISDWLERDAHYRACIKAAHHSANTCTRVDL